jgi:hypothetical protein
LLNLNQLFDYNELLSQAFKTVKSSDLGLGKTITDKKRPEPEQKQKGHLSDRQLKAIADMEAKDK